MLHLFYHNKNTREKDFKYILLNPWESYTLHFDHIHSPFSPLPQLFQNLPPLGVLFWRKKKILPHSRCPGEIIWKFRTTDRQMIEDRQTDRERDRQTDVYFYNPEIVILNNQQFYFQHLDCAEGWARSWSDHTEHMYLRIWNTDLLSIYNSSTVKFPTCWVSDYLKTHKTSS